MTSAINDIIFERQGWLGKLHDVSDISDIFDRYDRLLSGNDISE